VTTTTNFNVTLTSALQTELSQTTSGAVWAYAVYFLSGNTDPQWTELVVGGQVQNGGTVSIPVADQIASGKMYFIVQSCRAERSPTLKIL
jgi:hypothetical protein